MRNLALNPRGRYGSHGIASGNDAREPRMIFGKGVR
jgi:hypothetical protein